ncbi:hypothetical protein Cantr_02559 [Candida viswanathii]|uniref:Uncharacterized protein n=1 Tax=Candida viswanathii TaxID=5486 RepID=A0A367YM39_9ASCO|nr:hypothetical protein Cantr_02559 [Candida viswanathii]
MTQDNPGDIADAYKQLNEAEKQADNLERMLDAFEAKLDTILKEAENLNSHTGDDDNQNGLKEIDESETAPVQSTECKEEELKHKEEEVSEETPK